MPRRERKVVILGSGKVAPSIAAAFAALGDHVVIAGRDVAKARSCAASATQLAGTEVISGEIADAVLAGASLVVECVSEDLQLKQRLLRATEEWVEQRTILLSNTSSLALDEIARPLRRPDRFAGLHFLHPAHATRVAEVIPASQTEPRVVEELVSDVKRMGKRPIIVRRPVPGFVWNRLQIAMLRECLELVEQGVADADAVDAAVADGLAPRWLAAGPLATADLGGIATFGEVARQLFPRLSRATELPELFRAAEAAGGLYAWSADEVAAVETVRRDALGLGAEIAARRPHPERAAGGARDASGVAADGATAPLAGEQPVFQGGDAVDEHVDDSLR